MFQGDLPDFLRHNHRSTDATDHYSSDTYDDYYGSDGGDDGAPFIDPSTPTNVTVTRGKTAMLACVVRNLGTASVRFFRVVD